MKKNFVVIMGAGRCGSTSLVSFLNEHKNFHIYGENNATIINLLKTINLCRGIRPYQRLVSKCLMRDYKKYSYVGPEWYHPADKINILETGMINTIIDFFDTTVDYTGFKEIRWSDDSINCLNILENIYQVKYVHLIRDLKSQHKSMTRLKWKIEQSDIINTNNTITKFLKTKKPNQYIVKNISEDNNFLVQIYDFLVEK